MDEAAKYQVTVAQGHTPVIATCTKCGATLVRSWETPPDRAFIFDMRMVAIGCQDCGHFGTMRWWQQIHSPQSETPERE